ncbi:MAG: hypothetical protein EOP53_06200, partial [Sphingobacteriales bacterium]
MNYFSAFLLVFSSLFPVLNTDVDLRTPYEKGNGNQSATYRETMAYYKLLDEQFQEVKMIEYGLTDAGKPLNLVIVSKEGDYDPNTIRYKNLRIVLVNNAIHPGEPEGVDASMMLVRDLVQKPELKKYLDKVVFCVIPMYNIDGALNRGCCSRANQNGPEEYGFRGNGENLDLNRDFIKCDSKNARSFSQLFTEWQPDIFLDNHTSNGADYQYTLTYIANHPNTLPQKMTDYLYKDLIPALAKNTEKDGFPLSPYVDTRTDIPDSGLVGFVSPPRFSTGYASLFNSLSFTVETHMWKPFNKRVEATYSFMKHILDKAYMDSEKISSLRKEANQSIFERTHILNWESDESRFDWITFKGYEAKYKPSLVSGQQRLIYDRNSPYEKKIKFYNYAKPGVKVTVPDYYIVPQNWWRVIELLKLNGVKMNQLENDNLYKNAAMYYIDGFENSPRAPYEGHYLHSKIKLHEEKQDVQFLEGDYVISTNQAAFKFIVETLEPQAPDSYFAWNFFDAIMQQKEYFSDYIFEETAVELLNKNPELKKQLKDKQATDTAFAKNGLAQLDFVYK